MKQDRKSWAVYTDGTFVINDQFSVTAGELRYTKDKKDFFKPTGGGGPCNQYTDGFAMRSPHNPSMPLDLATNCIDALSTTAFSRAGLDRAGSQIDQRKPKCCLIRRIDSSPTAPRHLVRGDLADPVLDYKPKWDDQLALVRQRCYGLLRLAGGFSETCSQESDLHRLRRRKRTSTTNWV